MTDRPLVLSTSSITTYLRCHYAYLMGYVYRRQGRQSVPAAIGQAVHAGAEALHHEARGDWGVVTAQDALQAAWERESANVPPEDLVADPDAVKDAVTMLNVYESEVLPTFHPTLIEAPFSVMVEGVVLTGIIDGGDDDLRDLKTTAGKTINGKKPHFTPANYDMQLSLYSIGYQFLTGKKPKWLILDVLTRRGTYRQYVRQPKISEAMDVLGIVRDGILASRFEPTGALSGACHWCSFVAECPYATV